MQPYWTRSDVYPNTYPQLSTREKTSPNFRGEQVLLQESIDGPEYIHGTRNMIVTVLVAVVVVYLIGTVE